MQTHTHTHTHLSYCPAVDTGIRSWKRMPPRDKGDITLGPLARPLQSSGLEILELADDVMDPHPLTFQPEVS